MNGPRTFVGRLSPQARLGFALGLGIIILIVGSLAWWVFHPRYGLLFGHLRQRNAAEIVKALDTWHVPYRLAAKGTQLLVPVDQVYPTRMKLASSGVPNGGVVGFELFDHANYGITQFAQRVNYLRALQGELERTIDSMSEIDSARVHLTLQHTGLFAQSTQPAKGSVAVWLRRGRHLGAEQVMGIQRLVASAVEGLKPQSVVVLDQQGNMLSGAGPGGAELDAAGEAKSIEARLRRRARTLLADALHSGRFTVSVSVSLNDDRTRQVRNELLSQGRDGNGLIVRETNTRTPGTPSPGDGASTGGMSTTQVEYAHGSEQIETVKAPGRIEHISVGVVIPAALPVREIEQLKAVVSAGLGLDPRRGDRVDIATFAAPPVPPARRPVAIAEVPQPVAEPSAGRAAATWFRTNALRMGLGSALLILAAIGAWAWRRQRQRPPRLTQVQREQVLARIRLWVDEAERVS